MAVIRLDRFKVDPADAEEMLAKRNALVLAVRRAVPGLVEARLARLYDQTWAPSPRVSPHPPRAQLHGPGWAPIAHTLPAREP
jgi:hypothetical protein